MLEHMHLFRVHTMYFCVVFLNSSELHGHEKLKTGLASISNLLTTNGLKVISKFQILKFEISILI